MRKFRSEAEKKCINLRTLWSALFALPCYHGYAALRRLKQKSLNSTVDGHFLLVGLAYRMLNYLQSENPFYLLRAEWTNFISANTSHLSLQMRIPPLSLTHCNIHVIDSDGIKIQVPEAKFKVNQIIFSLSKVQFILVTAQDWQQTLTFFDGCEQIEATALINSPKYYMDEFFWRKDPQVAQSEYLCSRH